jgi:hypothetical protein
MKMITKCKRTINPVKPRIGNPLKIIFSPFEIPQILKTKRLSLITSSAKSRKYKEAVNNPANNKYTV